MSRAKTFADRLPDVVPREEADIAHLPDEMADVLYGVSMQADGVSKVVSQKLERDTGKESADDRALV